MSTIDPSVFGKSNRVEDLVQQFTNAAADIDGKSDTGHGHAIADVTDLQTTLDDKVDKVAGKQLSTNDYTTLEQQKLAGIAEGAQVNVPAPVSSVNSKTGAVVLDASDVGADPAGAGAGAVAVHESEYNHDSFLTSAPVTSVNGLTGDVIVSGGSSDVIGIRKLASVDGLTDWGSPSSAGLALSVSEVVSEKINGRFPYRLDCTGAVAGTYVPLPITVTEFEAGSTTGLSLWVKPGTGYVHGYLEAVLYDPDTAEILEPDVTLIRTGAHRHAWRVGLNAATSYQVWLRVTTAGGGQTFSLAFDDLRVAKDLVCGRWIQPFGGPFSLVGISSTVAKFQCLITSGISNNGSPYHPRWHVSTGMHLRGFRIGAGRIKFTTDGRLMEISLVAADSIPYLPDDVGALLDSDTTIVLTGIEANDVKSIKNGIDIALNTGGSCTFILYTSIDTSCSFGAVMPGVLVEAD